ncbi:MAG: hypothetical protein Tsb006_1880 [Rickettsiaceae bacterium]
MIIRYVRKKLEEEYHHIGLWYFASFIFGIIFFFQDLSEIPFYWYLIFVVPLAAFAIFFKEKDIILFFSTFCLLMFLSGVFISSFRTYAITTKPITKNITRVISGEVTNLKPTLKGYQVTIDHIEPDGKSELSKVRIHVADKFAKGLVQGDIISLKAKLFPLSTSVLPGTFDFGFYMYMAGIEASGYALTAPIKVGKNNNQLRNQVQKVRTAIYHRLIEVLGSVNGNFAAAILIGETKAIPKDVAKNMRETGVAHILSVSGLHLSLVAMIFFVTSRALLNCSNFIAYKANVKALAACISIIGSFAYLQISGSNIAATRAFIMTAIFIVAIILGRSPYPLRSVMVAAFVILLFLPEYVLHPSFQLSFAAVLCLISGYELYLRHSHIFGRGGGIISAVKLYVFTNIYSSFLASFVTAPYVIYHFYKFANYSVLMNLLAVPLMSFFMMPLALFSLCLMPIGLDEVALKLLGFFISLVISGAEQVVQLPSSVWYTGHITPMSLMVFTFGFFWICFWQTKWRFAGVVIMAVSLLMMMFTKKPDFIYDHNLKIIGIKNQSGKLELYSQGKIPGFTLEYWANWYGQEEADFVELGANPNQVFKIYGSKTVSVNYSACIDADLLILTSKKLKCNSAKQIISYGDIQRYKQVLIFCPYTGPCKFKFAKEKIW